MAGLADLAGRPRQNNGLVALAASMLEPGNINLLARPQARNPDGSISTVRSISFNDGGPEILIPTVINGRVVSNQEAIQHYYRTGEHLGKFATPQAANAYAQMIHANQARFLQQMPQ